MTKSLFALADAEFLSREQAQALAQRVLSFARADETRVNINSGWSGNTRFAGNEITTSGGTTNTSITVTSIGALTHDCRVGVGRSWILYFRALLIVLSFMTTLLKRRQRI